MKPSPEKVGLLLLLGGVLYLASMVFAGPVAAQGPCGQTVIVTVGDTLTRIAHRCNTSVPALLEANPEITDPNLILVGQRLRIASAEMPPSPPVYTVQPGDTLARIATRFGTTVEAILQLNPEIEDRDLIHVGQEVTIPAAATEPQVFITPLSGPPGTTIEVSAVRFPPDTEVQVGASVVDTEFGVVDDARTDADGELQTRIVLPSFAEVGEHWAVVVRVVGTDVRATSDLFTVTERPQVGLFDRVNIYLVALDDGGQSGRLIGCNDSLVPVEVAVEPTRAPLTAALRELLAVGGPMYGQSGLYNGLYRSELTLQGVTISEGQAIIRLSGTVSLGGVCDEPRFEEQLRATALQFSTVNEVSILVNGQPLDQVP